ncbi:MAG: magnesium chelatase [Methanobacteriota archaeon]|nr:MAG: magnesium chelatase [Euryarchaeota archaeon]
MTPEDIKNIWEECYAEVKKVVIGKADVLEDIMIVLLGEGHILLEGVPGIAKTHITNSFASAIGLEFNRAQFTPDLLPSDVLGTNIYDPKTGTFKLRRGPIFTNLLLADEINRSPPKTQAALLEAMAEKQVSIEGTTYKLDRPFIVIATQNPVEQEGTYPLPEAQVDRFGMKLLLTLPEPDEELDIIKLKHEGTKLKVRRVTTAQTVNKMIEVVKEHIYISNDVMAYMRDIIVKTRTDPRLVLGCSPRASIALLGHSKAHAALKGRSYVIPDDCKRVMVNTIHHRLQIKSEFELEGVTGKVVIEDIMNSTTVPV